ncbi:MULTISPECIES: DNA polymerase III subunit psi [Vibrio]|uniref:DNA polymerase III subunit psi n=1 Tax=Vibrio TaxID=662 RepID=UPI0020762CCC|nr:MULTISPECIES: DNA polymerase III subunit psi [Vibrio]USD32063.1 DNA polymerase III subunit psi [Vibrio sp. SCSIO 43186]USD45104.1 DNA polymerase III subunit psi [Vibrio sp. SCSIO 43145]USD69186.1 DNA polymerase III subunit psi [Vibrio sp. SCSIO 43139]USD96876.1 DNA polymerase III subunit psi [Vibrio coralliilyticus]
MTTQELTYLHEMGIQAYQLAHPERLQGYSVEGIALPDDCKMLLVSPQQPLGSTVTLFENILKTINLTLEQSLYFAPEHLALLENSQVDWIWFAGCEAQLELGQRTLRSPCLNEIDGNQQHKRVLWQQIQALK